MGAKSNNPIAIGALSAGQRRRIWQIEASMHCSVLGTCLSLSDLYAIARRARLDLDAGKSAYDIHSAFVDVVAFPNDVSKLVDKELEKRHLLAARKILAAKTEEEIEARWKEVTARGEIASAYWGAISHPLCTNALQWRLFGEVHMLSHLVGAARRSDVARVHELEVTCATLDGKLAETKHDYRAVLRDRKRLEDELTTKRRELDWCERRLQNAHDRIAILESETRAGERETYVAELERRLRDAETRTSAAVSSLSNTRTLLEEARSAQALADEHANELSEENEALELELATTMVCPLASNDEETSDRVAGLLGKRILCVGGRSNLVQHYRALVERRGGEFLHHDGGLEESLDGVTRALTTVDAVFCPVDCVSHAACLKVKKACKHLAKQFIPLRSSGLSSFARGIQTLASPTSEVKQ
jgi:hypothetical protein